jgi:hypothetical protein
VENAFMALLFALAGYGAVSSVRSIAHFARTPQRNGCRNDYGIRGQLAPVPLP